VRVTDATAPTSGELASPRDGRGRPLVVRSQPRGPNERLRRLDGVVARDPASELLQLAATVGQRKLEVDTPMVSRWERGIRRSRRCYVHLLCRRCELEPIELGLTEAYQRPA
jgi:hypothetical protein